MRGIAFDGWILRDSALWLASLQSRKEECEVTLASCWSARTAGALGLLGGNVPSSPAARAQRSLRRSNTHLLRWLMFAAESPSIPEAALRFPQRTCGRSVRTRRLERCNHSVTAINICVTSDSQLHNVVRRTALTQYESSHLMRKLHYCIK